MWVVLTAIKNVHFLPNGLSPLFLSVWDIWCTRHVCAAHMPCWWHTAHAWEVVLQWCGVPNHKCMPCSRPDSWHERSWPWRLTCICRLKNGWWLAHLLKHSFDTPTSTCGRARDTILGVLRPVCSLTMAVNALPSQWCAAIVGRSEAYDEHDMLVQHACHVDDTPHTHGMWFY